MINCLLLSLILNRPKFMKVVFLAAEDPMGTTSDFTGIWSQFAVSSLNLEWSLVDLDDDNVAFFRPFS